MNEVTCILTSCGRWDLLDITLESFFKFNTNPIKDFIIYDDSGKEIPAELRFMSPVIKWFGETRNIGQIKALDFLWSQVETEYAFCMEDDWKFLKPGFIENSMKVLQKEPKILMCWLKELEHKNTHPIIWKQHEYGIFKTSPTLWAWHRFNPALKRKADYDLIAPFSQHTTFDRYRGWKSEAAISQLYNKMGFTAAMLSEKYITHIGENRRA